MVNWVRGSLKVKGTKDNIVKFLTENLRADNMEIRENEVLMTFCSKNIFYIKGVIGDYIGDDVEFHFGTDEEIKECKLNNFSAPISINPEPYKDISKKYDINIVVGGIEPYGGFLQEFKIEKGEIVTERVERVEREFIDVDDEEVSEEYSISLNEKSEVWDVSTFIRNSDDNLEDDDLPF